MHVITNAMIALQLLRKISESNDVTEQQRLLKDVQQLVNNLQDMTLYVMQVIRAQQMIPGIVFNYNNNYNIISSTLITFVNNINNILQNTL